MLMMSGCSAHRPDDSPGLASPFSDSRPAMKATAASMMPSRCDSEMTHCAAQYMNAQLDALGAPARQAITRPLSTLPNRQADGAVAYQGFSESGVAN